jgi:hypothetical protein
MQATGQVAWAALSANGIANLQLPPTVLADIAERVMTKPGFCFSVMAATQSGKQL